MENKYTLDSDLNLDAFRIVWKKILLDSNTNEKELFTSIGDSQQNGNRKIRTGTIKFIEFANLLGKLGYTLEIKKKDQ